MDIQCYIHAAGDERAIKSLSSHVDIKGAEIKHLVKVKKEFSITGKAAPWIWKTSKQTLSLQTLDEQIQKLLIQFAEKYDGFANEFKAELFLCLQLVVYYDDGDSPVGLYFSRETIVGLAAINAAIDVDPSRIITST